MLKAWSEKTFIAPITLCGFTSVFSQEPASPIFHRKGFQGRMEYLLTHSEQYVRCRGLFLLVKFVKSYLSSVKQEFNCISTLFFNTFCRPNIQAVWQTFCTYCVISCFFQQGEDRHLVQELL